MRSGSVNLSATTGTFMEAGSYGYLWSSRMDSGISSAYDLWFSNQAIYPSNTNWRAHVFGLPLRCLSTVLDI